MKTENFDDAFKQKFESNENDPAFTEQDIAKLQQYVNSRMTKPSFARKAGIAFLLLLSGSLIIGLFSLNQNHLNHEKALTQTIDSLKQKMADKSLSPFKPKSDTIYIVKYATAKTLFQKNPPNAQIYNQNIKAIKDQIAEKKIRPYQQKSDSLIPVKVSAVASVSKGQLSNLKNKTNDEKEQHLNLTVTDQKNLKDTKNFVADSLNSDSIALTKNASANFNLPEKLNNDTLTPTLVENEPSKLKSRTYLPNFKNLTIRAGINEQIGPKQFGIGIMAGICLSPRWTLAAGLQVLKLTNEKYEDGEEFHTIKGRNFGNSFNANISDTTPVSNIRMHNTILQLPITLSYTLPLVRNYSLQLGLGTDIDLFSWQRIAFSHQITRLPEQHTNLETRNTVLAFNNIVFTTSLQKRWKNYIVSAGPYISPQIASVLYKKEGIYSGIKFQLVYNFGK
jgi:hypothetical protein